MCLLHADPAIFYLDDHLSVRTVESYGPVYIYGVIEGRFSCNVDDYACRLRQCFSRYEYPGDRAYKEDDEKQSVGEGSTPNDFFQLSLSL